MKIVGWIMLFHTIAAPDYALAQVNPANLGVFINTDPKPPGYNPGNNISEGQLSNDERWVSALGAVATDAKKGKMGAAEEMRSRKIAEEKAMQECLAGGAEHCVIEADYRNLCGVLVSGDSRFTISSQTTVYDTERDAFARCSRGDRNCQVQ